MSFSEIKRWATTEWQSRTNSGDDSASSMTHPFEKRIVLERCGLIDPEAISHAIANGAYDGLSKALAGFADQVLSELELSKLRKRDGTAEPLAKKWRACSAAAGEKKFIVGRMAACAGTGKDHVLLSGDPHAVLEGMLIAAYAVGAGELRLCIDAGDTVALQRARMAIEQAGKLGLLGENILGSNFCCEAMVCEVLRNLGDEPSKLLNYLEGKPARTRVTPPSVEIHGLQASPTVVESFETLAQVAVVLRQGAVQFASTGAPEDPGTKLIALAGKFENCSVIEVPTGISLRQVVSEIGVPAGKLKAVQLGYPAGPWLPESALDVSLDCDALRAAGCRGPMDVITAVDISECAVELARRSAVEAHSISCGQCVFGREGTRQLMDVLTDLVRGRALAGDIELLLKISDGMKAGALCADGRNAPDAVTSALTHFRAEFDAHVSAKQCPSSACYQLQVVGK
jgi:NADH:ubiquinone oxidoreductase subunit F (NADH-binding)